MTSDTAESVTVDLGGRSISVPKGGLFDRYRMATPLDEIEKDSRVPGVDFFRSLPKTEVDSPIGKTLTPNFYYAISTARLVMLVPTRAIRRRLPAELTPLQVAPGLGIVSLMMFRYDVCDIDFYTEAAVGIAVRPVRNGGRFTAAPDLASALGDDHLHAYVLALPVNTAIAQTRGHDGYGFPKWVADLDVEVGTSRTGARLMNDDGGVDFEFSAPTPKQKHHASGDQVSTLTSYTQRDGAWFSTLNQTNVLSTGTTILPRQVDLRLGTGRVSDELRALKPLRTVQFDATTKAQAALHMPVPVSVR